MSAPKPPDACRFMAGCRFRQSCSFHHGDPSVCPCSDNFCTKGHPSRAGAAKGKGKGTGTGKGKGKVEGQGSCMPNGYQMVDHFEQFVPAADSAAFIPAAAPAPSSAAPAVKRGGFTITIKDPSAPPEDPNFGLDGIWAHDQYQDSPPQRVRPLPPAAARSLPPLVPGDCIILETRERRGSNERAPRC